MKKLLALLILAAGFAAIAGTVHAVEGEPPLPDTIVSEDFVSDTIPTIFVNTQLQGTQAYKQSGNAWHFATPEPNPFEAFVRVYSGDDYVLVPWTGNGSEHLPCEFGIHWIYNGNRLTVSHCLENPATSTTTTTTQPTTTAPETTVPETTAPTTTECEKVVTTDDFDSPSQECVTDTTAPTTTRPTTPATSDSPTSTPTTLASGTLPNTGSTVPTGLLALAALTALLVGVAAVTATRRPS